MEPFLLTEEVYVKQSDPPSENLLIGERISKISLTRNGLEVCVEAPNKKVVFKNGKVIKGKDEYQYWMSLRHRGIESTVQEIKEVSENH